MHHNYPFLNHKGIVNKREEKRKKKAYLVTQEMVLSVSWAMLSFPKGDIQAVGCVDASGDVQGGGVATHNKGSRCVLSPFCHWVAVLVLLGHVNTAVSGSGTLR